MTGSYLRQQQQSLALATSLIHRSRTLDDLCKAFFFIAPKHISANAFGMYLFDRDLNTKAIFSYRANHEFLDEYETIRGRDPLFNHLLQKKRLTHSLEVFDRREWLNQPLSRFLSRWGLAYSIEAPLVIDGRVKGTLNIARSGNEYFDTDSLDSARFLCSEIDVAFNRIHEFRALSKELAVNRMAPQRLAGISGRARQVLDLATAGAGNREIASRMNISENTVRHHLKRIYRVLGVHNRAQLVQRVASARQARLN